MQEAKPFASLSSSLLARKGHAKPAMRPQSFHMVPGPAPQTLSSFDAEQDDLGWNDMGHDGFEAAAPVPLRPEQPPVAEEIAPPPVVEQQEKLARQFPAPITFEAQPEAVPARLVKPRAAPGSKGKAAFTLRLDGERHLRLRLVCAVNHRSAQQIVTLALDEYLARQPDNAALAAPSAS